MADYNLHPGMDASYNFPPQVRAAMAQYSELQDLGNRPPAGAGTDLNDQTLSGIRYIPGWVKAVNRPPGSVSGYVLPARITGTLWSQIWFDDTGWQAQRVQAANGTWRDWVRWGVTRSETGSAIEGAARLDSFIATNASITTSNKGAIAFIVDHGLTNFKSKGIPNLFSSRGFKYGLALNSGTLSEAQNSGASTADVLSWSGMEIWNHGKTHAAQTTEAGVRAEILDGKAELESIFGRDIFGFVPAGVGPTGLMGFDGGGSPEMWANTLAGQLITGAHALTTGYMGSGGQRQLNGYPQNGQSRFTMDTQTVARIKTQINLAISSKVGIVFMFHPSLLDTSSGISTANLTEVLNYAKTKETSGELAVLAPSELMRATTW